MSPEERRLLQGLFDRMRNQSGGQRDHEAEQMIADNVRQQPYAPYLLSQTVIVQDQALQAANQKLQDQERQIQDLQRGAAPQQSGERRWVSFRPVRGWRQPIRAPAPDLEPGRHAGRCPAGLCPAAAIRPAPATGRPLGWRAAAGWRRGIPEGRARRGGWCRRRRAAR